MEEEETEVQNDYSYLHHEEDDNWYPHESFR